MSGHKCHVPDCSRSCAPKYLMCASHWHRVPCDLQLDVYKHYRSGQCDDKRPKLDWMIAAHRAINSVTGTPDSADLLLQNLLRIKAKREATP